MKAINLIGMALTAALSFSAFAYGDRSDHSHAGGDRDHDRASGEKNFTQDLRGEPDAGAVSIKRVRSGLPAWKYQEDSEAGEVGRDHR